MTNDKNSTSPPSQAQPTVLVIEPSGMLRKAYRRPIEERGLKYVECSSITDALEMVCEKKPSAILTALELPGLSGASLIAALRSTSLYRAIPIALITSTGELEETLEFYTPDVTLSKGADLEEQIAGFLDRCWLNSSALSAKSQLKGRRVLVAEDSVVNRVFVGRLLHALGADVDLVVDGVQAMEAAKRTRFDVVLMDLEMPRMDGREAAIRLSALYPELPVIALSGHEAAMTAALPGFAAGLNKPVKREEILELCDRLLAA